MNNNVESVLSTIGIIAYAGFFIIFPIYAAVIAFQKGRKGWGIASLVSIFVFAGWLVGAIALFVKPDFLVLRSQESLRKKQRIAFGAFFITPIVLFAIVLIIRTNLKPPKSMAIVPTYTVQPTIQRTPIHPQIECNPSVLPTPMVGEDIGNIISTCSCLNGVEVTVAGRLCIPRSVTSNSVEYLVEFLPKDSSCSDDTVGPTAAISKGNENNMVREVTGMYSSMEFKADNGNEFRVGRDGEIVILRGTLGYSEMFGACYLNRVTSIEESE
jgi:hypothetical protein